MSLMSNLMGFGGNSQNPLSGIMNIANIFQKLQQFAQNPLAGLMNMRPNVNIPNDVGNDPQAMVKYLIQSGQMSQNEFNQYSQTANQWQNILPKF